MSKLGYIRTILVTVVFASLTFAVAIPRAAEDHALPKDSNETAEATVDPLSSTSSYFTFRRDVRRCASPMCGGYFVRRVNEVRTLCSNGHLARECYVAEINWNGHAEPNQNNSLLRGDIVGNINSRFGRLGRFRVREVWEAAGSDPNPLSGDFYRVRDRGVRCITHPCLTHHEARLNSTISRDIAGVDLNHTGASASLVEEANRAMTDPDGVLVTGTHERVTGPAGRAQSFRASQFYLQARSQGGSMKPCIKTGCSGQVCSDQEVVTTCEYRPEYDCYKRATCERQANGECGFNQTPELRTCLNRRRP